LDWKTSGAVNRDPVESDLFLVVLGCVEQKRQWWQFKKTQDYFVCDFLRSAQPGGFQPYTLNWRRIGARLPSTIRPRLRSIHRASG